MYGTVIADVRPWGDGMAQEDVKRDRLLRFVSQNIQSMGNHEPEIKQTLMTSARKRDTTSVWCCRLVLPGQG